MNCLNCKRSIPKDSEFCPYCGSIVEHIQTPVCKNCGRAVPDDSEFCPYCGTVVTCNTPATCNGCGKALLEDAEFCPYCGRASILDQPKAINPSTYKDQKPKARKKAWIWAIPVTVIVLVVGILFWWHAADRQVSIGGTRVMSLNEAAEAVLYLEMYDENDDCIGSASGFLVNDQTTLVTNYHVVQDAYKIVAWTAKNDISVEANLLLACDEIADLAVLKCDEPLDITPLYLEDSDTAVQGDSVYAVGYPLGVANTLSDGVVSSRYYDEYGVDVLQVTAAISEGNSGGPLLNENGQVVGVVCAYYVDGQNLNVGVTSNTLNQLLSKDFSPVNIKYWKNRPIAPWEAELESWGSVTLENLQGTWIAEYSTGHTSELTISGDYGYFWVSGIPSGEGLVTINDRSQFGLCPEVILDDGNRQCTLYILYVEDSHFYSEGSNMFYYKQS